MNDPPEDNELGRSGWIFERPGVALVLVVLVALGLILLLIWAGLSPDSLSPAG
jgi:hypothetical protein